MKKLWNMLTAPTVSILGAVLVAILTLYLDYLLPTEMVRWLIRTHF